MVWSQPGMGKSNIVAQTTERIGFDLYDLRLSGREPVDVMGLPFTEDGMTKWETPAMLPRKGTRPSVLFLDEINRATQMMLNTALQLVLDRRVGDYRLPDDCVVLAAGNRSWRKFAGNVAQYINHGVTAVEIISHIGRTRKRVPDVPAAKELMARRGGFTAALSAARV
jgi:MoxR-like ATPase